MEEDGSRPPFRQSSTSPRSCPCGVLLAESNNDIPTGEQFEDTALTSEARAELHECYASHTPVATKYKSSYFGPIPLASLTRVIRPWNETAWYEDVAQLPTPYKGIHPVRVFESCMERSLDLALENLPYWWRLVPAKPTIRRFAPGHFPYFTNTLWLSKAAVYAETLRRIDLSVDVYDEVAQNRYVLDERHGALCVLFRHPFVHPAYNTNKREGKEKMDRRAAQAATAYLLSGTTGAPRSSSMAAVVPMPVAAPVPVAVPVTEAAEPRVAVVIVAASPFQNVYFWPSYRTLAAGHMHDHVASKFHNSRH